MGRRAPREIAGKQKSRRQQARYAAELEAVRAELRQLRERQDAALDEVIAECPARSI